MKPVKMTKPAVKKSVTKAGYGRPSSKTTTPKKAISGR